MESPEVKKRKLIAQLVAAANRIIQTEGRTGQANYIQVPAKNIEVIAKKFGVSVEEAQEMLKNCFEQELNKGK
jgi:NACalpha-BTF3-like transcription factor